MRKFLLLGTALFLYCASFASANVVELPVLKADQVFIPIGKTGQKISYAQLATISMKDLEALTGKKMNFFQRLNFRMAQIKIRKSIAKDGTIHSKQLNKAKNKSDKGDISKGLYIVLAIFGLAWIAMGVMDDWSGNNWWINLILTLLFWLPGFIHAMIKMKDYYQ